MLKKRTLSLLLSIAMLLTFMPAPAFAEGVADDISDQTEIVMDGSETEDSGSADAQEPEEVLTDAAGEQSNDEEVLADAAEEQTGDEDALTDAAEEQTGDEDAVAQDDALAEENPAKAEGDDSWTVAIYMCGSDLERDNSFASSDIREMLMAEIPDNVNLLVLTGGAGQNGWHWRGDEDPDDMWGDAESVGYVTPEGTQIWRITHHNMTLLKEYDEYQDLRKEAVMEEFFKFAVDYADAKHMVSMFWNHGGGPIKGAEYAQAANESDLGYASLNDIERALEVSNEYRKGKITTHPDKFDFVGFDNCLMGSIEIAYALSDTAEYLIASEEVEPSGGWNYCWLELLDDVNVSKQITEAEALRIGKEIITRYVDPSKISPLGDARDWDESVSLWTGHERSTDSYTMALIDLDEDRLNNVMKAIGSLGKELNSVYDAAHAENASEEDKDAYYQVAKAAEDIRYMVDGEVGQVDIYLMADAIRQADVPQPLKTAAQELIDAAGAGDATTTVSYEDFNDDWELVTVQGTAGQLGSPADSKLVIYRGLSYKYAGGLGVTMFYPDITGVNSEFLYAVNGKNADVRINGVYPHLTFSEDPAVAEYIEYVGKIADQRLKSRDYGVTGDKITADIDDETNMIYAKPAGDVSRLTKVIANVTMESDEGDFYLGSTPAEYSEKNKRYEIVNQDVWGSINSVPFTYTDNGDHSITAPVIAFWDGESDPYPNGGVVKDPDTEVGKLKIQLNRDGTASVSEYTAPVTTRNYNFLATTRVLNFHPLRLTMNEDGSYGDYIVNPLVKPRVEEQYLDPDDEYPFAVIPYIDGYDRSRPSASTGFILGYRFMAYDMNEKAYVSDSAYTVNMDLDKVSLEKVPDQKYTGKAVTPAPTFTLDGITDIDLETLQFFFADVTFKVSYKDNIGPGTGTVVVDAVRKTDGKIAKTYTKSFNIVQALDKELAAPENLKSIVYSANKKIALDWNAVSGATSYQVAYRKAGASKWTTKTAKKDAYTVKSLKNGALYDVKVKAIGKSAASKWSNAIHRYIRKIALKRVKAGKKKVTVTWKKDSKATGYQIKYSYSKNMKGAKTITVKGKSKTKATIKNLKKGKRVYVRVRPLKTYKGVTYYGILSARKSAKVK